PDELGDDGMLPQTLGGEGYACSYDSQCAAPYVCIAHECLLPCKADEDCSFGHTCEDGVCDPVEPECVPGQQKSCGATCGVKRCDDMGFWMHECDTTGCEGTGGAGGSGGAGASGATGGFGGMTSGTGGVGGTTSGIGGAGGIASGVGGYGGFTSGIGGFTS